MSKHLLPLVSAALIATGACGRSGTWTIADTTGSAAGGTTGKPSTTGNGGSTGHTSGGTTTSASTTTSGSSSSGAGSTSSGIGGGTTAGGSTAGTSSTTGNGATSGTGTGGTGSSTNGGTTGGLCGDGQCVLADGSCGWNSVGAGPCGLPGVAGNLDCCGGLACNSSNFCISALLAAGSSCSAGPQCASGICGVSGNGHCCLATCVTSNVICGAMDCDTTGACEYASTSTLCGMGSCTGSVQTNPQFCTGVGTCLHATGESCAPYVCGETTCLKSCSDSSQCIAGDFCDVGNATCCSGLVSSGTLSVDGVTGDDATACCGLGGNGDCQTLTKAMALIDSAQAQNVTINATVGGGGGDWTPNEVYPVVLGWGVELSAPGVFFVNPNGDVNSELLDINHYSSQDPLGSASIVGTTASPIGLGMNAANTQQSGEGIVIKLEDGSTLYIANASVNGSAAVGSVAIWVQGGAALWLGQDQSSTVMGTVFVGNAFGDHATNGGLGIECYAIAPEISTVQDAPLGGSSVIIQGQEDAALLAGVSCVVSLSANPTLGTPPSTAGFGTCPSKMAGGPFGPGAVVANGGAEISLKNATIQCVQGAGVLLMEPGGKNLLAPTITVDNVLIQNTSIGIEALAGTVTVTNSTIAYNFEGVVQSSQGTGVGSVDLSGGGNTVVCSSRREGYANDIAVYGISVVNDTDTGLAADNVAWDTPGPDYFFCDSSIANCTCQLASCTIDAGTDGMDVVQQLDGGITTTGNTLSTITCN